MKNTHKLIKYTICCNNELSIIAYKIQSNPEITLIVSDKTVIIEQNILHILEVSNRSYFHVYKLHLKFKRKKLLLHSLKMIKRNIHCAMEDEEWGWEGDMNTLQGYNILNIELNYYASR